MSSKDTSAAPRYWSARIIVEYQRRPIDEILKTGIIAPNAAAASSAMMEVGMAYLKLNYGKSSGYGISIQNLTEETSDGKKVAQWTKRAPQQTAPSYGGYGSYGTGQVSHNRAPVVLKPFKCPIFTLCKDRVVGKRTDTAIHTSPVTEESS